jgi:hypothetical protein
MAADRQTDDLDAAAHFAEDNGLEVTIDRGRSAVRTEYLHSAFGRTRDRQICVRMLRSVAF